MDDLLSQVVDAHGGFDRWSRVTGIMARMRIGGPFWASKGQPGIVGDKTVELDARRQHIGFTPFGGSDWDLEFGIDPEHIAVTDSEDTVVEERTDPRNSFAGYGVSSRWDMLQSGYFISYAMWNYLTEPFLLGYPGVEAHEIGPWEESGETWRRLEITFPKVIATHSRVGIFYFDADGMQRRMDYEPMVNGNAPTTEYTYEPRTFDGIVVPTRRRIRQRLEDGAAKMSVDDITIDIHDVEQRTS
jgi:hypothetical protein